jgi:hypothetical protein
MLQAIESGEDISTMSERLIKVEKMNEVSAIRAARTMTTSFENLGRLDGMRAMKEDGTIIKKQWLATISTKKHKTREWHKELSGQTAELDEPFINYPNGKEKDEIMYPGDPNASAANVYNCRCTLIFSVEGFEPTLPKGTIKVLDNGTNENKIVYETNIITRGGKHIDFSEFPLGYSKPQKLPKEQETKILEFEKNFMGVRNDIFPDMKDEVGLLLDKHGNVLFDSTKVKNSVTSDGVYVPTKVWKKGSIFTHYHPENKLGMGGTFSYDDLKAFSEANSMRIERAYSGEGKYTITKLDNFKGEELAKHMAKKEREFYDYYRKNGGGIIYNEKEYRRFLVKRHDELLKNQKKYGYIYTLERW